MFDLAVIGAGASGMVSAISAKRENRELNIVLIEALHEPGKKILATGNGRCNLSNRNVCPDDYNNAEFTVPALCGCSEKTESFFRSLGVVFSADEQGRIYPMSNTASSVQRALMGEVRRLDIKVMCNTYVSSIARNEEGFVINRSIRSRSVIIACSGMSSPSQGSDGSGYKLLRQLGHRVTDCYPGLVRMNISEKTKSLSGIRVKAELCLETGDCCFSSEGELQFTENGLSGIAVMDLSNFLKGRTGVMRVNVLPAMKENDVAGLLYGLRTDSPQMSLSEALNGILPRKLGEYIVRGTGIIPEMKLGETTQTQLKAIAARAGNMVFNVTGTDTFRQSQITVGGADVSQFDPDTLQSKSVPGLFCTGEILDVSARCGGFNLQWAWSSGMLAGKSAALLLK